MINPEFFEEDNQSRPDSVGMLTTTRLARRVSKNLGAAVNYLRHYGRILASNTRRAVLDHPRESLIAAAAAGLVLGGLLRAKR